MYTASHSSNGKNISSLRDVKWAVHCGLHLIKWTNHEMLVFSEYSIIGHHQIILFILKGNFAPESAVLKLSGKDISGAFRGPVGSLTVTQP